MEDSAEDFTESSNNSRQLHVMQRAGLALLMAFGVSATLAALLFQ